MHCNFHLDALARVCTFKMDIGHFSSHLTILTCVWKTRKTTLKQKCTEKKLLFFSSSKFSMIFYFKSKNSLYWYSNCQTLILPQGFYSQKSSSFCPSTSEKDILTEVSLLWAGCNFTTTILMNKTSLFFQPDIMSSFTQWSIAMKKWSSIFCSLELHITHYSIYLV